MDYALNTKNAVYQAGPQDACAPETSSASIISRLNGIRMGLAENRSSANHAADKIVGSAPTPLQPAASGISQIKGEHPPACCFIDALQQVIGDIEAIARDTQEHLNRLHRSF